MFNIIDIIVLLIILISVFFGYKNGFIKTIINLLSFFIAIGLALMFYKPLAVIITENTTIDDWIIKNIVSSENISNDQLISEGIDGEQILIENDNESAEIEQPINDNISFESIFETIGNLPITVSENIGLEEIKNNTKQEIAHKISELIMNLLSLIIIYVIVKITLWIATFILDGIMHFPILKQLNEVLGMAIGAVIGFIEVYVSFAVITFLSSVCDISVVINMIKASAFASVLYENNLIINLLF